MKCFKILDRCKYPNSPKERLMISVDSKEWAMPILFEPIIGVEYDGTKITEIKHVFRGSGDLVDGSLTKEQEESIIAFIKSQCELQPKEKNEGINIELLEQECGGNCKFNGHLFVTKGIEHIFGKNLLIIVPALMAAINSIKNPNYLQVAIINGTKTYIIDDVSHVTILLPEEY